MKEEKNKHLLIKSVKDISKHKRRKYYQSK